MRIQIAEFLTSNCILKYSQSDHRKLGGILTCKNEINFATCKCFSLKTCANDKQINLLYMAEYTLSQVLLNMVKISF